MEFIQSFQKHWQQHFVHIAPNNSHLLLAVSGGLDSVVLVDLITKSGYNCSIAHCNFTLRDLESDRDEQFVIALGNQYNLQVHTKRFATAQFAVDHKISTQEAARNLRYQWFQELLDVAKQNDASKNYYVLTAHHADDNIETVVFNFFRGTGISGLHGILPVNGQIIRPLLFARRTEIAVYAAQNKISWVEDSSNATDKYSRNFIRHQVLPLVKNIFPSVEENLLHNINRISEIEQIYQASVQQIIAKLIVPKGVELHVPILKLQKQQSIATIVFELIKPYNFTAAQVPGVLSLCTADNAKFVASTTHRIIKNRNWLIIAPSQIPESQTFVIESDNDNIIFGNQSLQIEHLSNTPTEIIADANKVQLDAAQILFPLLLRKAKTGDYFYPLGMTKKKKVSRFLIDQKLSATQKEKVWVLESNQRIVWIVGYRIDNRFKISPHTKQVLQLQLKSANI
jgi:tRNA(Ile)-lysidine synthase